MTKITNPMYGNFDQVVDPLAKAPPREAPREAKTERQAPQKERDDG